MKILRSVLFFLVGLWFLLMGTQAFDKVREGFGFMGKMRIFPYSTKIKDLLIEKGESTNNPYLHFTQAIEESNDNTRRLGNEIFFITGCVLILCSIPKDFKKKEE